MRTERIADAANLRAVIPQKVADTLSFALRFDNHKRVHYVDDFRAQITAERIVRHLEMSGFVLLRKPPVPAHAAPAYRMR